MYESLNKKVQEIVRVVQLQDCTIEGKKITLNDLDRLCQYLNRSDKEEIADLIGSIVAELEHLYGERRYLDDSIKPLEAAKEKLARIIDLNLD
jgi:HEPN domain-containing protein